MKLPQRKSPRLQGYDYSQDGAYFVTICTKNMHCLFGKVINDRMSLNQYGKIAHLCWLNIPGHFQHIKLDHFIVMPNHIHGIIILDKGDVRTRHASSVQSSTSKISSNPKGVESGSLGAIIGSYKSAVTKQIHALAPNLSVWHGRYHDHIIRSESSLNYIRRYIIYNPELWNKDRYYRDDGR